MHIGQAHFPFEGPCGLRVIEVEVMDPSTSQAPPGAEGVTVVTSSHPSSSVPRLRSITSPLIVGDTPVRFCGSREVVGLPSFELSGRWKNPVQSSCLLWCFSWSSDESPACTESRRVFLRSSSRSVFANSTSSSDSDGVLSSVGCSVGNVRVGWLRKCQQRTCLWLPAFALV